ncbi:MAG: efflux RND transporter periplasmic adaptor subunit [Sterolibacteriaceae bacterium MAG5]|nr:efflux RND transporter periplasmic adaptor subunit [Candidatus Nitricoxidireducens bremensis]
MKPIYPILLTLVLAACGEGDKKAAGPGAGAPPPPEVEVVTVSPVTATLTQELPGRLQAVRTAQVRARVEGVVEKRLFVEGSDVEAGAPLFQLDARTYRAAAASAESDVAVARITLERYKPLLDMKAVSKQEYDLAEAKVKQAEAVLAKANLDLENANVLAPISGRIGRALVTEGALVGKGEATHLATIEQLNPIYANFTQSNADLLRLQQAVKAGKLKRSGETRVDLVLEDGSLYSQQGRILFTDLAVDPNTGSVQLRAEFPNPKSELLPGTFVRVRFPEALAENAIRVPQRAVQAGAAGQYVLVIGPESKVVPQPVKAGGMSGSDWIIAEGLKGGEQVIVNGVQKARPGSPVKPMPWNPASPQAPQPSHMSGMSGMSGGMTGMAAPTPSANEKK